MFGDRSVFPHPAPCPPSMCVCVPPVYPIKAPALCSSSSHIFSLRIVFLQLPIGGGGLNSAKKNWRGCGVFFGWAGDGVKQGEKKLGSICLFSAYFPKSRKLLGSKGGKNFSESTESASLALPPPPPQKKLEGLIFWGLFSTPPHEIWDELVGFGVICMKK